MALFRQPRQRPVIFLGLIAFAAIATGIAFALRVSGKESVVLPVGNSYTEGVAGTWQRINPVFANTNEVDQDLVQLVFSGLVRLGADGLPRPDLAELPEISEDGRTYTFRLRDNLRWHDGQRVTSHDVAFTVGAIVSPDFKGDPALAEAWAGVGVETPDDRTVVFKLRQASSPFLARYATIGVIPSHLLESLTPAELYEAPFNSAPVGTGPFRLEALDSHQASFAAYDGFHFGRPAIGTVRIKFYSDYPASLRALTAGEVQGVMARETLTEGQRAELDRVRNLETFEPLRAAHILLYLNNDQSMFQDARVRTALSLALDRASIVDRVFVGGARASSSPVAPETWAYAADYDRVDTNIPEARRLLTEAGWVAHPTTGILVREGAEFRFTIRTDNDAGRVAVATEVARALEPLGIRATVASTTFSVLRRDFLEQRRYDAAVAGWDQGADPDPYFGWHSSQTGAAGLNIANFSNAVTDELISRGRTRSDIEIRRDSYRQFQEKWLELTPSIIIAYPRYTYLRTEAIHGDVPKVLPLASNRFAEIWRWTTS